MIEHKSANALLALVQNLKTEGYRLGQICATPADNMVEVLYTFEKNHKLRNFIIMLKADAPELQSVTASYPYAFIYENEMHDLFGIKFKNLAVDYEGKFFKIAESTPWKPVVKEEGGEN